MTSIARAEDEHTSEVLRSNPYDRFTDQILNQLEGIAPMPTKDEQKLGAALHLIKLHITEANSKQNRDLHAAVQLIVDVARAHGMLQR